MNNLQNSNQISTNVVYAELQNPAKKSYSFQNLLIIVLFTYMLVSYLTPKVTVDNYTPNTNYKPVNNKTIPSYFEIYGEKADKAYYSEFDRYSNNNNQICDNFKNSLRYFADSLAEEKCTYTNCTKLIAYLAKDKVMGSDSGSDYMKDLFQASINNKMNSFINSLNGNMSGYQSKMQQITQEYAYNICTNLPSASKLYFDKNQNFDTPDFRIALANLGISGTFNAVSVALDVGTLVSTGFFSSLRKYIVQLAWTIFKSPIKKAAVSVAASAADGPLPIGDIIGVIGIAWTAYDITSMRADFQKQVADSIYNKLYNEINNVKTQSSEALNDIHSNYQQIRLDMEIRFKKEYSQI